MTVKKISLIFFVGMLVILTGFLAVKVWAGMCTDSYCDSDITSAKTLSVPPTCQHTIYTLSFDGITNSSITVSWSSVFSSQPCGGQGVPVFTLRQSGNPFHGTLVWSAVNVYSKTDSGLYSGNPYCYQLTTYFSGDGYTEGTSSCASTSGTPPNPVVTSDTPTRVQAFANSPSTIYLNWKDNATSTAGSYEFVVQRMRVTPNNPITTSAIAGEDSSNNIAVSVKWADFTTSTPYYAVIERSTDPSFVTTTLFHYEGRVADLATSTPTAGYTGMSMYDNQGPKSFSTADASVNEATTYYYRVRECSQLDIGNYYALNVPSVTKLNSGSDGEPTYSCTGPSPAFGTTTPPYAPTSLTATVNVGDSTGKIDLNWVNASKRASYLEVERNGSIISTKLPANTASYSDGGLSPNTPYTYQVRSCYNVYYDYVMKKGATVCSNLSGAAMTTTNFAVSVTKNGSGNGTVTSADGSINCGTTCSADFPAGTSATLSAVPDGNSTFAGWSGDCSGTGSCVVSGNANVAATFNLKSSQNNTLTIALNPQARVASVAKVTVNVGGNSIVVTTSTTLSIASGTPVSLTASSDPTIYTFSQWTGSVCNNSTTSVCSFTINTSTQITANFISQLSGSPNDFTASLANAASSVANFTKSIAEGFAKSVSRVASDIASGFGKMIASFMAPSTADAVLKKEGQITPYDSYFISVTTTTNPVVIDSGLLPDTVYVYRVKVLYNSGGTSGWSNWAVAKTLYDETSGSIGFRPICIANSVCKGDISGVQSSNLNSRNPQVEESEQQCVTNANCVNVGRVNKLFREK